ncbi:acetyl-CoA synthetase-like protein [Thozetella sp. PMI_491]|nr:acetyl-CoA synthetase-like protein [Thozetella sp. PMI_491]
MTTTTTEISMDVEKTSLLASSNSVLSSGPDRLLPQIVESNADVYPKKIYAIFPRAEDKTDEYRQLNYQQFANSINRAAWWLDSTLGTKLEPFETFTYIGPKDVRYSVLAIAAIKAERKVLFPSPFSSIEGLHSLLETTKCKNIIRPPSFAELPLLAGAAALKELRIHDMLSMDELLSEEPAQQYLYDKSYAEAKDDPVMIVHTSGTTGNPKPLFYTNGSLAAYDAQRYMPDGNGPMWWHLITGTTIFSPMPTLHAMVLGPGNRPLSADVVKRVHRAVKLDGGLYPPSILEELCKSKEGIDLLAQLKFVMFTGAPLSKAAGDAIASHAKLHNMIGSTELGVFPVTLSRSDEWEYYNFSPLFGYQMEKLVDREGYELVLHRDPALHRFQSVFHLYPDISEYRTKDSFIPHPTKPGLWKYHGRIDDLIILSHGEDLAPVEMEKMIGQHLAIAGVVIGGEGRHAPFVIVERSENFDVPEEEEEELLDQLWPSFVEANKCCSKYVQLQKSLVLFTKPDKPLARTLKGSISRQKSLELYRAEVDSLYA